MCAVLDSPVCHSTLPYEVEILRNKESSIFINGRRPSPLIRDHNRVGGDIIVIVEIIAGGLMRAALRRQGCRLVAMLETNKSLPSGNTGFHLKIQLKGSNESSKQTAAYR